MTYEIGYDTDKHRRILRELQTRIAMSRQHMQQYYTQWAKNEESFRSYIPASEADRKRAELRKEGKPVYTTIQVPYSYAVAMTAHTYWTSVFLSRSPIMQFAGRHGEAERSVQAVEALIDYQVMVGQMMVPLYIWLLDPLRYGFGIVGVYWDEQMEIVSEIEEKPETFMSIPIPGKTRKSRVTRQVPGYAGNRVYNVRPQDFFPDPRVPLARMQEGEFCGRYAEISWNTVLKREEAGLYFNVDKLELHRQNSSMLRELGSSQVVLPDAKGNDFGIGTPAAQRNWKREKPFVSIHEIYVELSPDEWELGSTRWPEKWVFTVAEDAVIIGAQPLGFYHNRFPFFIQEYEPDGYSLVGRSMFEILTPLQDTITWLLNTHMHNVRRAINSQFVVDPSRVVMKDVMDPDAGKIIRLKPEAYGSPTKDAVHQLEVMDVTKTHLNDMGLIMDLFARVTGVNDNIMGMLDPGGRKTATEVRASGTAGVNRLKTAAEYMGAMGWTPLAQVLLQNTQQKYDQEKQFRIAGDLLEQGQSAFINVTPELIAGAYDYLPVDGTMPIDRMAQANLWRQFMADVSKSPEMMQAFPLVPMGTHMMQLMGLRDIKKFQMQVVPDGQLQQQVQQGNSVPAGPADLAALERGPVSNPGGDIGPMQ